MLIYAATFVHDAMAFMPLRCAQRYFALMLRRRFDTRHTPPRALPLNTPRCLMLHIISPLLHYARAMLDFS